VAVEGEDGATAATTMTGGGGGGRRSMMMTTTMMRRRESDDDRRDREGVAEGKSHDGGGGRESVRGVLFIICRPALCEERAHGHLENLFTLCLILGM
jgi:hypothetical protein